MCIYEKLGLIDHDRYTAKTEYLPPAVYSKGISPKQEARWNLMLAEKGRIPYIEWPHICARCGAFWPDFFMVSDADWERYIEPDKRDKIVCLPCYREIKRLIDTAT
ncbi:MAG: hypothetical protein ACYDBJ_20310 [Aggregatilineales bacterium]